MTEEITANDSAWPLRPLLLAGLGALTGIFVYNVAPGFDLFDARAGFGGMAVATGAALSFILFSFTLERRFWPASLIFAAVAGLVGGLIFYWSSSPGGWNAGDGWRWVSLMLAIGIAAPLFQAARDVGAVRFPYASVHDHAWTNVVLWGACWVFVGVTFAMLWLLAALFNLIGIKLLETILEEGWVIRALAGGAFGAAVGLLREHDRVVHLLQRVVAMVLAVLAPVLAFGLVLFVLSLPFTGLNALWEATKATTPILLSCAVGALILANAVIGNAPEEERRNPALRIGAMALAAVVLPLAVLAAIATGLRIGQYGFTPERLWAAMFVAIACLYGAFYLASLVRGRMEWAGRVRPANLLASQIVCGIALILATPLVSFNAISTRDQVARLESGKVTPDKFDWRALAFDFGAPGKAALKRLQSSANAAIRQRATDTANAKDRYEVDFADRKHRTQADLATRMRLLPAGSALPPALLEAVAENYGCTDGRCTVLRVGADQALLFRDDCYVDAKTRQPLPPRVCQGPTRYVLAAGKWVGPPYAEQRMSADPKTPVTGYAEGRIEIRTVPRRQAYVGGVPVGEPFE